MKNLNGNFCVQVKDKRYRIHPIEKFILGLREEQKSDRTQYQDENATQSGRIKK